MFGDGLARFLPLFLVLDGFGLVVLFEIAIGLLEIVDVLLELSELLFELLLAYLGLTWRCDGRCRILKPF